MYGACYKKLFKQFSFSVYLYFCPSICPAPYHRNHTPCTRHFFHFLEIFVLHAIREGGWGKRLNNGPNYSLYYCLCHLSATALVRWCKIMGYGYVFFIFKTFWFIHLLGDKKEKRLKIAYYAVQEIYLQPNIIWSFRYASVKKWYIHVRFSFFWKF